MSLYLLWVGDPDFNRAEPVYGPPFSVSVTNEVAWNQLIHTIILNNSNAVNRLYAKGARTILFQTFMDDYNSDLGTNHAKASENVARFNAGFIEAMNI